MGLLNVTRDTSLAYKGVIPSMADVYSSTEQEFGYTASGIQAHNILSDEFANQLKIAKSVAPELFTEQTFTAEMFYRQTKEYGQEKADAKWSAGQVDDPNQDILWRNHAELMKKFPDAGFKDLDTIYSEGGERVASSMKQAEYDWEHSDTISGTLGWLGGTISGAAQDPFLAISMLIPQASAAKGVAGFLGATAKVGLLETAIESGIQAGTFQFKKEIGLEPTFEQAIADIAAVGLSSVLIYGGGSALIRGFKSRLKSGETPNTPQARQQLSDLEQADDLVREIQPASPEELQARMEELRMAQSEALTTGRIDGVTSEIELASKQTDVIDSNIASIESDISALAKQRDELVGAIDQQKADIKRAVELESVVTGKLSRAEKKQLKKEITEAMAKGEEATVRIQSRTDANYDQMIGNNDVSFNNAAAATRAKNKEIRRPIEEQMAKLEAKFDAGEAADSAVNELRALKVRLADSVLDPTEAALRINEFNARIKANDQELFGLQVERGEAVKPKPAPVHIEAIDQAIDADVEVATPIQTQSRGFDLPEIESLGARKGPELHKTYTGVMPTFQGGKQKMAKATSDAIRHVWNDADRAKITEVDDYFGGGGGWGIYNALTHYPNVKKIRLYEMNPDRIDKIKYIHQHGDTLGELLSSGKPKEILDLAAKDMDAVGAMSASALSRRVKRQMSGRVDINDAERGALAAVADYGEASYGTRVKDGTGQEQVDAVTKHLSKQFTELRRNIEIAEQRGIEIEYVNGNSYDVANPKGDHVLGIVDPPYYNTKGYPDPVVKIGTYNDTRKLLERLNLNKNSIIYTDEAWWTKKEMPKDMDEIVDGFDARGILNDIDSSMEHFVTLPIAGRTETLGLTNGTRTKQSTKSGDNLPPGSGREATVDGRQRSSSIGQESTGRVVGEPSSSNRAVPAAKLSDKDPDLSLDDKVSADIADAQKLIAEQEIDIPTVDDYGNEVLRPASEILAKLDNETLTIERILECGKQ